MYSKSYVDFLFEKRGLFAVISWWFMTINKFEANFEEFTIHDQPTCSIESCVYVVFTVSYF